jgi:hypothetical protein
MKKIIQKYTFNLWVAIGLCLLASCNLKLQEPFEFVPETPTLTTFKDQTAWSWIQKEKSADTAKTFATNKFDYLIEAVKLTGLEAEYSKAGDKRTFILLNNTAFTGTGKILQLITGSATGKLTPITDANKVRLTNLLKYHIIDAYVDQVNALPVYSVNYEFKTLGTAPNDMMTVNRNERFGLTINASGNLPATRRSFAVLRHNYIFGNGIGHIVDNYAGLVAF